MDYAVQPVSQPTGFQYTVLTSRQGAGNIESASHTEISVYLLLHAAPGVRKRITSV
jgi:hypothetical protein